MARTFIGRLVLSLQDSMSGKARTAARNVDSAVDQINQAGRRLGSTPWGIGFQRQLDRLRLSPREFAQVQRSWDRLHAHIQSKGLRSALARSEVANWRAATVANFARVRAEMDTTERRARRMREALSQALRPGYVALGGYTGAYMGGLALRQAFTAASEGQRVQAEAHFAGLSEGERGAINARSEELAERYRMPIATVFEVLKDASLNMPSTESALELAEPMTRSLLVLANLHGSADRALAGLRKFNRSMDNIEKISPEEYLPMLEGYMRMQQVIGTDMDPGAFEQAIKYSRAAGKVHSTEFLTMWLPQLISQVGGSNAGTQLRAGFDQFIVGRASKQALSQQRALGIRGDDNALLQEDLFGQNPIVWFNEVLLPQLEKRGVDTGNEVELARVIGQLTNNRMSSDFVMTALLSYEQMLRIIERAQKAMGTDAADQVQDRNPFASWQGFADSLKNLSAAVLPMESISSGLNSLADSINDIARAVRRNPELGKLGFGAAAVGAVGGTYLAGRAVWGLVTAGTNLNSAALALQRAAAMQGAATAGGGAWGRAGAEGGKGSTVVGWRGLLGRALGYGSALMFGWQMIQAGLQSQENKFHDSLNRHSTGAERFPDGGAGAIERWQSGQQGQQPRRGAWADTGLGVPSSPFDKQRELDALRAEADSTGRAVQNSLSVTARPEVDTSSLQRTLGLIEQIRAGLAGLSSSAARAEARVSNELDRTYSDFGVAP